MSTRRERDHCEQRDAELGKLLLGWAEVNAVAIDGPLDAPGMDPRWIARFRSDLYEADLMLFYGPFVHASAYRPTKPGQGYFDGGEDGVSDARFIEMLDDLAAALSGGPDPIWLRLIQS
jgi:hypothetical protein